LKQISLYLPCFNAAQFLPRVLPAVMAQTHPLAEVIVVDDGSTDDTAAVAESYIPTAKYPLRVLRQPRNMGLAAARNVAVRAAASELIAALDSDVVPAPDWLAQLERELTDDVSGVGGELLETYQTELADRWRTVHMVQHRGPRRVVSPPFLWGCNTLFRRSVLFEAGLYDEVCRTNAEDVKLCEAIRDRHVLVYTHLAKCRHLRRDTPRSLIRNYWKWYYYGCYQRTSAARAFASNLRNLRRLSAVVRKDIADGDFPRLAISTALLPYSCAMDWLDWWRRRGEDPA
jgi:glycosyltransferase involved in cell wall biosynthesis